MATPHFVVVITTHGTLRYAQRCVESIRSQLGVHDVDFVYLDDASGYDDAELEELRGLVEERGGTFMASSRRLYQLGALTEVIGRVGTPQSVICLLDGDDYLLPHALATLSSAYADPDVAMTYGSTLIHASLYQDHQCDYFSQRRKLNTPYPPEVWQDRTFRQDGLRCFHLRTFRRWLWDRLDLAAMRHDDGRVFQTSGDGACLFPMLEMLADPRHVRVLDEPIYVYRLHGGNVHQSNRVNLVSDASFIRDLPPYAPLDRELLGQLLAGGSADAGAARRAG